MNQQTLSAPAGLRRRRFVQGLTLGGSALALGLSPLQLLARERQKAPQTLRGNTFDLSIGHTGVNFTGRDRLATTINGSLPAPILHWRESQTVTLRVTNRLPVTSSIHWHGILLPFEMDGVPGISFDGIQPGETFTYRFPVKQSGTYWYHSHSGFQEQAGMYGAIVIDPAGPDPVACDRDYVVVLSDWSDEYPMGIFKNLKVREGYYNYQKRTVFDTFRDFGEKGVVETLKDRHMWNQMRMSQSDLSDVTGATYTFLMNGNAPAGNWTALFNKGERVRLRFINASAMTFFDVRIPGLKMTVVAADGQNVEPVTVEEFRFGVAETVDVVVEPQADIAYTVFAQAIDRSGYARGTLTPDPSLTAAVPALDPVPILGHREMGMGGMNHGAMSGMDHSGMDHASMNHDMPDHPDSEFNPGVNMHAPNPQAMLDDPGIGLRNNGRRVLTYADLHHLGGAPDSLDADREIRLHLTGNMERYMWSFDGIKFADAEPLVLHYGERVRITLVNDTMMHHPIHLHGMWSDLEVGGGSLARKHTVTVKPGEELSYLVRADALGGWAYHCHLLYHMDAGMFRKVVVK